MLPCSPLSSDSSAICKWSFDMFGRYGAGGAGTGRCSIPTTPSVWAAWDQEANEDKKIQKLKSQPGKHL